MKIEVRVNFMDKNNIFFPYKNWVKAKKIKVLRRRCFATYISKEINEGLALILSFFKLQRPIAFI